MPGCDSLNMRQYSITAAIERLLFAVVKGGVVLIPWGTDVTMIKSDTTEVMSECLSLTCLKGAAESAGTAGIDELQDRLMASCNEGQEEEALELESLNLPVLFLTGSADLTGRGMEHVRALTAFLLRYPDYAVRLNGHSDPRGSETYNMHLSEARAQAVSAALQQGGVAAGRIRIHPCGAHQCVASSGDMLAYAHERRVDIEVLNRSGGS